MDIKTNFPAERLRRMTIRNGRNAPILTLSKRARCRSDLSGLRRRRLAGKFQDETGALSQALTVGSQRPTHVLRHPPAAVQAEAMTILAGRETVSENPRQILRWDAHAIVPHFNLKAPGRVVEAGAHCQTFFLGIRAVAGLLRIANQVDQYLENQMLAHRGVGQIGGEIADDADLVPRQRAGVHLQSVLK